mmetsp:Transcript_22857/g.36528  ORF Transcript_22857/g.36528 Transcript_22857/m.36528 type:complete len:286 (+) Transcript_22857:69-926(+)
MHRGILRGLPVCLLSSSAFADRPFAGNSALLQLANATSDDKCENKVKEDGSLCCPPNMRNTYSVVITECTPHCKCGFVFELGSSTYSQRHAKQGDVICRPPCRDEHGSIVAAHLMFFREEHGGKYVFNKWMPPKKTEPVASDNDEDGPPVTEPPIARDEEGEFDAAQMEGFELLDYCEALDALVNLPADPSEFKRFLQDCTHELKANVEGLEAMYDLNEAAATNVKTEVAALEPEISKFIEDKSPAVFKISKQLRDHERQSVKDAHEGIDAAYRKVQEEYASPPE